jgi:hypothetical protein
MSICHTVERNPRDLGCILFKVQGILMLFACICIKKLHTYDELRQVNE